MTKLTSLGVSWDDVVQAAVAIAPSAKDYFTKAGQGLKAGQAILDDPYFGEGVCHILRLQSIEQGKQPGPACPRTVITTANARKGVGLRHVAAPLRAAVYTREHPWVFAASVAALVGVPFVLGYVLGKGGSR